MGGDSIHKFNVKTHLCPLEVRNRHILKEFHPGTPCCQGYFQPASGAILETWVPFGLEHQDLVIQTIRLSNIKTTMIQLTFIV
jgi:hypothetical protein